MACVFSVGLSKFHGNECLRFQFDGHLEAVDALRLIAEWEQIFAASPNKKYTIIWDCLKMTSYDSEARVYWSKALKAMKSQIREILIITDSSAIKMGASIMAMVTKIKIRVFSSEVDI